MTIENALGYVEDLQAFNLQSEFEECARAIQGEDDARKALDASKRMQAIRAELEDLGWTIGWVRK